MTRIAPLLTGLCALAAVHAGSPALGQIAAPPQRAGLPTGMHVSAQVGLGYYGGDLDADNVGRDVVDPALTAEIIWQPTAFLGLSLGARRAQFPRLANADGQPRTLGIGYGLLRLSPSSGRFTPYGEIGIHRTLGGNATGYGPVAGFGLLLSVSRVFHLFAESSMFFVSPDDAADGTNGGTSMDQLGFVGIGIRLANPGVRYPKRVQIERVDGPRTLIQGETAAFRAVVKKSRSAGPVVYHWSTDTGQSADGEEATFVFQRAGAVTLNVTAQNTAGIDLASVELVVMPTEQPAVAAEEPVAQAPPRDARSEPLVPLPSLHTTPGRETPPPDENAEPPSPEPDTAPDPSRLTWEPAPPATPVADTPKTQFFWVLGSFTDEEQAIAAAERFRSRGLDPIVLPTSNTPVGPRFRVAAGSFSSRSEALDNKRGLPGDAWLLRIEAPAGGRPATRPAPDGEAVTPRSSEGRPYFVWVVASHHTESRAQEMVDGYRQRGFLATIHAADISGSKTYRVALGQFFSRADAVRSRTSFLPSDAPADSWLLFIEPSN